jgi:cell wall-associated NlpC family hydrolase
MVIAAQSKVGVPYRHGATGPDAFDCSGLVQWAARSVSLALPRTSFDQFGIGQPVDPTRIVAGDLVFFDTAGPGASHVGIALDGIHAISATSHGVRSHEIFDAYWGAHHVGARRLS